MLSHSQRYVYPIISPPTPAQLEQDKQAIDESFEKAFSLLDQLAKDTEALKSSEQVRTDRLDAAMAEVESVIGELRTSSRRREEESRRITDEVRGLKDLIPKAMENQKESTDTRLRELNTELKSLKTLMGQRMNSAASINTLSYGRIPGPAASTPTTVTTSNPSNSSGNLPNEAVTPKPASVSSGTAPESVASLQGRGSSPFNTGAPPRTAAIPAWQMAMSNKSSSSVNNDSVSGSQEVTGTT